MSDNSTTEEETIDYVLYANRPEWRDVTPIPQNDTENAAVLIAYSDKFKDVHDYFRAVLKSGEKSERVLELTRDAACMNPANYTAWQYRREVLFALDSDLWKELAFIQGVIEDNPKNYQVWHHRRVIVDRLQDGSRELAFTDAILKQDPKNYHTWQYRQWVLKTFNLFDGELDYVDTLLQEDIRNNSAWNQRYFVINNTTGFIDEVVNREVEYTIKKIEEVKENESAWNYLRGLLLHESKGLSKNVKVANFCKSLYESGNRSPFLLALIIDMCEECCTDGGEDTWFNLELAQKLCEELSTEQDTIRSRYWEHVKDNLNKGDAAESFEKDSSTE